MRDGLFWLSDAQWMRIEGFYRWVVVGVVVLMTGV